MTPAQWNLVKELFAAARERLPGERAALLAELSDAEVRAEVESLLRTYGRAGDFIEPPQCAQTGGGGPPADTLVGQQIAGYRIVGILGQGGMGTVYEAEQEALKRRVALKLVGGVAYVGRHAQRLFQRETLALARLNHPAIAAIYDVGHTDDRRHYFVMERIDGVTLIEFARRHELGLDDRLELFIRICGGVEFAHQHGVIHRDLKPSNILIPDGQMGPTNGVSSLAASLPQPKILDFGLARITDADTTLRTIAVEAGKVQGTLAYMSPEQTYGADKDLDLRSDIYSLGVVLYELLADQLPYDVRNLPLPLAVQAIREDPPRRLRIPASIAAPGARAFRADLETILLKTLEKEPRQRYQSVHELADDIQRCRDGQPILAQPHSALYHVRRLAARYKYATGGLVALVLLLTGFGGTVTVLYQRALGAERTATDKAQVAGELSEFLLNLVQTLDSRSGEKVGFTAFWGLVKTWKSTADRAETLRALLDARYRDALALLADTGRDLRSGQAQGLCNLGWLLLAAGETHRAQGLFLRIVHVMRQSPERFGPNVSYALSGCDMTFAIEGRFEEAADASRLMYENRRETLAPGDWDTLLAASRYANKLLIYGRISEACEILEPCLPWAERAGSENADAAAMWEVWGAALLLQGRYEEAEAFFRRAIHVFERADDEEPPALANANVWLVACLLARGAVSEAERVLAELRTAASANGSDAVVSDGHSWGIFGLRQIARYYIDHGEPERARALFGSQIDILGCFAAFNWRTTSIEIPGVAELLGPKRLELVRSETPTDTVAFMWEFSSTAALTRWTDPVGAFQLNKRALAVVASKPALIEHLPAAPLHWQADLMHQMLRFTDAADFDRRAYEMCLNENGRDDFDTAGAARALGHDLLYIGRFTEAEELLRAALPLETVAGLDGFYTAWCYEALGAALVLQGRYAEAEPLLRGAVERRARWMRVDAGMVTRARIWLCACLFRLGRVEEAEALLNELAISQDDVGVPALAINVPFHVLALRELVIYLVESDQATRALELVGDNPWLALSFVQVNESVGTVPLPGLLERHIQQFQAELAQLQTPGAQIEVARRLRMRGLVLDRLGDYPRALEASQAAAPHLLRPDEFGCERCGALWTAGRALRMLGRHEEAVALMAEAYEGMRQPQFGPTRADTLAAGREYATELLFVGRAVEAEALLRAILPHELDLVFPESSYASQVFERLGAALVLQGRHAEALPLFRRARTQRLPVYPANSGWVENGTLWLIACLFRTGQPAEAETLLKQLQQQMGERLSLARPNPFSVLCLRAVLEWYVDSGDPERAAELLGTDPRVRNILTELNQRLGDLASE